MRSHQDTMRAVVISYRDGGGITLTRAECDVYADRIMQAHGERVAGVGYCSGCEACTQEDRAEAKEAIRREAIAMADEAREAAADAEYIAAEEADCAAGFCGHYTCTEAGALGYWAGADRRMEGNR